jgi:type III secretory pathway component EscV
LRAYANITVEFGPAARALVQTADMSLREQIRATTQDWLDALNLPVDAAVELTPVEQVTGPRFLDVAVILNGVRCGFTRRQLAQAYESSTRRAMADLAAGVSAARELLAEGVENQRERLALAQAFLAELIVEAVKSSAGRVITPEVVEVLLTQAREESATVRPAVKELDRSLATAVLRRLVGAHVAVQDVRVFVQEVFRGQVEGWTAGELAEGFIDQWRDGAIEIRVDPALAKTLLKDDPVEGVVYPATELEQGPANTLGLLCDGLFYELGVWFARFTLVADAELPADCFRFRIHQRLTPVLRGIGRDELLVNETPERLAAKGFPDGRPRTNPENGNPCAVISRGSQQQLPPEYAKWDQFEYIVLLLSSELRLAASTLLSLNDVEDLLGKLNSAFPALVSATLHQYSPFQVAQVLRWLLRDGVSIRDLRSVLEFMLDFSYSTGVRSPTAGWAGREPYLFVGAEEFTGEPYFTADDPYVPQFDLDGMQLFAEPAQEWIENGRIHAEFVKCGLRQYVTHKVSRGQQTIICHLLDADIEKRLLASRAAPEAGNPPFSERELAEILQGLGEGLVEDYGTPVLFLATTPDVALLVQDMIGQDFPEVKVLHRQLVEELANVQPIASVPGRRTPQCQVSGAPPSGRP